MDFISLYLVCFGNFSTRTFTVCLRKYVIVVFLDDKPLTEKYTVTENMLKGRVISKCDLGHFFVKCLSTSEWDGKTVGVCGEYS